MSTTDDAYSTAYKKRGKLIIINNENFESQTRQARRDGTDKDEERLKQVFGEQLGFEVTTKKDMKAADMLQLMLKEKGENHSDYGCFAVAVLTHGDDNGTLFGVDDIITVDNLVAPIKDCQTLVGKPKLFFFQACRGTKLDPGQKFGSDDPHDAPASYPKIPTEADFLYAYSSPPGYFAWRNGSDGSWFIQSVCDQLVEHCKSLDLVRILTRANRQVAIKYASKCESKAYMHDKKQIPSIVSMLTRELYFTTK